MREGNYACVTCGIKGFEKRFPRGGYGFYTSQGDIFLSIDQIVAKSRGGTHERSNLRVLCTSCNTKKGVKNA